MVHGSQAYPSCVHQKKDDIFWKGSFNEKACLALELENPINELDCQYDGNFNYGCPVAGNKYYEFPVGLRRFNCCCLGVTEHIFETDLANYHDSLVIRDLWYHFVTHQYGYAARLKLDFL